MENLIKGLLAIAPFLAPYPPWVKFVFVGWVGLTAVLLVALILARPVTVPSTAPSSQRDAWMVIEGMEFFAAKEGAQVQVVANVNGTEFVYPSKAGVEWLEIGPSMSPQVFRLPSTPDKYVVRFSAVVRVPEGSESSWINGQLKSVNDNIVAVPGDIPYSRSYLLHTFDPVHRARSAQAEAELKYRITFDPG